MKNLIFVFIVFVLFISSCIVKEEDKLNYTVSGYIYDSSPQDMRSNKSMKNIFVELKTYRQKNSLFNYRTEKVGLGSVYTDYTGHFSINYKEVIGAEELQIFMDGHHKYTMKMNHSFSRSFAFNPHSRIVLVIENQSNWDTMFISDKNVELFDSLEIEGYEQNDILAIPVKGRNNIKLGYSRHFNGMFSQALTGRVNILFSNNRDDLKNRLNVYSLPLQTKGAPLIDTVNIKL